MARKKRNRNKRPKIYEKVRSIVMARDGHRCRFCGSRDDLSIDHIKPLSQGGDHSPVNMQVLCIDCHRMKDGGLSQPSRKQKMYDPRITYKPAAGIDNVFSVFSKGNPIGAIARHPDGLWAVHAPSGRVIGYRESKDVAASLLDGYRRNQKRKRHDHTASQK